jgi:hypothetical protein
VGPKRNQKRQKNGRVQRGKFGGKLCPQNGVVWALIRKVVPKRCRVGPLWGNINLQKRRRVGFWGLSGPQNGAVLGF